MIEQSFHSKLPFPLPRDRNATIRKWASAHQDLFAEYDRDIEAIRRSHRITEATDDDLDEIGDSFGRIGKRRGRGDEEYRQLLMSIDSAFAGRGTPRGVRFAVGAGVRADPDEEVTITEYFDQVAYSLAIENWTAHRVSTVHELADLADPSGVRLNPPIVYDSPAIDVGYNASDTVSGTVVTSPDANVAFGAGDTMTSIERAGAGAGRFDGLDEFGESEEFGDVYDSGEDSFGQASYSGFSYGRGEDNVDDGEPDSGDSSQLIEVDSDETLNVNSPMAIEGTVWNAGTVNSIESSDTQSADGDTDESSDDADAEQNDAGADDPSSSD